MFSHLAIIKSSSYTFMFVFTITGQNTDNFNFQILCYTTAGKLPVSNLPTNDLRQRSSKGRADLIIRNIDSGWLPFAQPACTGESARQPDGIN
jgi:hypothetical protein